MSRLNEDQIADLQETFVLFDNKGDGKISGYQIGEVLRAVGQNPTEAEVRKCGYEKNPEQRVSFETFLPIHATVAKNRDVSAPEDFVEGFKVFDKDQNGTISVAELRHLLTSLGEKLSDDDVEQLFVNQEDAQGNINYEEFVKLIMQG